MNEFSKGYFWAGGSEPNIEIIQEPTIPVPVSRYDELIESETELNLLKKALLESNTYTSLDEIKRIFGLKKGFENEQRNY